MKQQYPSSNTFGKTQDTCCWIQSPLNNLSFSDDIFMCLQCLLDNRTTLYDFRQASRIKKVQWSFAIPSSGWEIFAIVIVRIAGALTCHQPSFSLILGSSSSNRPSCYTWNPTSSSLRNFCKFWNWLQLFFSKTVTEMSSADMIGASIRFIFMSTFRKLFICIHIKMTNSWYVLFHMLAFFIKQGIVFFCCICCDVSSFVGDVLLSGWQCCIQMGNWIILGGWLQFE